MVKGKLFDFVLRQEPRPGKSPPYAIRAHVVINETYETRGFKKRYTALSDVIESREDVDAFVKLLIKEAYALRQKVNGEFDAVDRALKKANAEVEEAAARAAKKAAELAEAEAAAEKRDR